MKNTTDCEYSPKPMPRRQWLKTAGAGGLIATIPGLAGAQSSSTDSRYGIEGYKAPELELSGWTDRDGKPTEFSISDSKGKWVFLKCFQYWCPGCHSSGFPTLQAVQNEFGDNPKVAIAAVQTVFEGFTTNTEDRVEQMRDRYALTVPMAHDPGVPDISAPFVMRNYRTGGTPWLILIDPTGTVVFNSFHVDQTKLIKFLAEQVA